MPSLSFHVVARKNDGLILSPSELIEIFLFGIPLRGKDGKYMSQTTIRTFIKAATEEIEKYLSIKIIKQVIKEDKDFNLNEFKNWSFVRTTYPVVKAHAMDGYINDTQQINYPKEWLSTRTTSDGSLYHRHIYLIPANSGVGTNSIVYTGITPYLGFFGNSQIPNYWKMSYCTGFNSVPNDLLNFIGMLASLNIFMIMGDIVLPPGISSTSIGIDGLSQSLSSAVSSQSGAFGGRIKAYLTSIETSLKRLTNYYKGFEIQSM